MRFLGIDYGTKKVGLALTDEGGHMAFPHAVVPNDGALLKTIEKLAHEKDVKQIVIGHSLDKKGVPNAVHAQVEEFMQDLTLVLGVPIALEPEQYTTQEALRAEGRTALTDASAAAIILNSYLAKQ